MNANGMMRLGDRLKKTRRDSFIGRDAELRRFGRALDGGPDAPRVLFLHGPGGVGKSALVRRFADEAELRNRPVVQVDGRTAPADAQGFGRAVSPATEDPRAVLLIDTFEDRGHLETWLFDECLPYLPDGTVTVVAGRQAPDPVRRADPAWADLLDVVQVTALDPAESRLFLLRRGIPEPLHQDILSFTGGHPLALALAAAAAVRHTGPVPGVDSAVAGSPGQDVIAALLRHLVGDPPTRAHRAALEVCAHAHITSEQLLRALLGEQGRELFAWLREQPYIETTTAGVHPHDVVREALEADLRWRDPDGFADLHTRLREHLLERVRTAPPARFLHAVGELQFLYRRDGFMSDTHRWHPYGLVEDLPCRPSQEPAVVELVRLREGADSARIAAHWLARQPEAFRIQKVPPGDDIAGCSAWLKLTAFEGESHDPVAAVAWEHVRRHGPLRTGEHISMARFHVGRGTYQRPSPVMDLVLWRMFGEIVRDEKLAWTFIAMRDDGFWDKHLLHCDMRPVDTAVEIGGHRYRLFAHDWRPLPTASWLAEKTDGMLGAVLTGSARAGAGTEPAGGQGGDAFVVTHAEFTAAARSALRTLRWPDELALSPLQNSRLVRAHAMPLDDVLRNAIDHLPLERGGERGHRAALAAFVEGASTQEAAARRLGLPFSTYRRHLAGAVERITDIMWRHEIDGTPLRRPGAPSTR
ncbi:AAA family ATPase [Streptomyces longisporoflavus]|uniref:AAA family ATPase n=1 Tax=Streptomyces longisporoflavus TaxID=28044 RepID=A0ABW7QI98_9ACTN